MTSRFQVFFMLIELKIISVNSFFLQTQISIRDFFKYVYIFLFILNKIKIYK